MHCSWNETEYHWCGTQHDRLHMVCFHVCDFYRLDIASHSTVDCASIRNSSVIVASESKTTSDGGDWRAGIMRFFLYMKSAECDYMNIVRSYLSALLPFDHHNKHNS